MRKMLYGCGFERIYEGAEDHFLCTFVHKRNSGIEVSLWIIIAFYVH